MVSDPASEEQSQRVLNIVSIADNSQVEYARRLIKNRREYLTGQGSFDFKTAWSHMPKDLLFSDTYIQTLQSWSTASHEYDSDGNRTANAKIAASKAKARRENMQQAIDNLEGQAWSMFQRWLDAQPQKPSNREMADAYTNVIEVLLRKAKIDRNIRDNEFFININSDASEKRRRAAADHSEALAAEIQAEDDRRLEEKRKWAEKHRAAQTEAMFGDDVDIYWNCDTNRFSTAQLKDSSSVNILYVPADSPLDGKSLQVCCGKAAVNCIIRTADIDYPALSTHAAWSLGIVAGQDHSQIRIDDLGVAHISPASDIPQAHLGRYIFESGVSLGQAGSSVTYEPDDGKWWTIENKKLDPAAVRHINSLVQAGKHTEAKQYFIRLFVSETQPVADAMAAIGLRSAALEYSLRDTHFHMGENGLNTVIRWATKSEVSTPPYKAMAEFLSSHTQADLLRALHDARDSYYRQFLLFAPAHKHHRASWSTRNRRVLNNSFELLTE